ncbi:hypothetical protein ABDK56_01825 [Sphingomonas sp. ASV193]|uniref:hypothetical protein n=1 Tax=Sphingomonas sp. ASV193 TaxID=3144405 RepID=UPI0032E89D48
MKKLLLTAAVATGVGLSGCASDPYGYNNGYYGNGYGYNQPNGTTQNVVGGAALGAAAGAVAGAVIPGVSVGQGAVAGAILGGVAGAVIKNRQYYRDTRGYCYYVDQYGNPIYDYNTRC